MIRVLLGILPLWLISISIAFAQNPVKYVKVKAEKSQGVYGLLRQYDLLNYSCNLAQFYSLNTLKPNASLVEGKLYALPIRIMPFDGKSIRSSLKITNLDKAKDIDYYNSLAFQTGLKKTDYRKDKQLWLPYHFEKCYKPMLVNAPPGLPKKDEIVATQLISTTKKVLQPTTIDSNKTKYALGIVAESRLMKNDDSKTNKKTDSLQSTGQSRKVSNRSLAVPLFGETYEEFMITSEKLVDQVFYIVPGHGGPDPGAVAKTLDGNHTICEDEYAYDVSLRLAKNLMQAGAKVYIIVQDKNDGIRDDKFLECDCDEKVLGGRSIPLSQKKRLRQGMNIVNQHFAKNKKKGIEKQWMISIHVDSRLEHERQDVFFYYQSESEVSEKRARRIQEVFDKKYELYRKDEDYSGTVTSRPLFVMRTSEAEALFVELGNIRNKRDQNRILLSKNRQLLADWLYEGFLD